MVVGLVTVDGCREERSHPVRVEQHDPHCGHETERLNNWINTLHKFSNALVLKVVYERNEPLEANCCQVSRKRLLWQKVLEP